MSLVKWFKKLSRRVIHFLTSLMHHSKDGSESEKTINKDLNNKPMWITRHGVDVAVVISPELFETLVEAQEELEDIAAVDAAMLDNSPGIPWEQVQKNLGLKD
jgi:uncharacterized protein (DUF2461 family)